MKFEIMRLTGKLMCNKGWFKVRTGTSFGTGLGTVGVLIRPNIGSAIAFFACEELDSCVLQFKYKHI